MAIADSTIPWSGALFRHRPAASSRSVLDDTYLGQVSANRWSGFGIRAYYFASDRRVVLAEHARHIQRDLPAGRTDKIERAVFRVPVKLATVLDLTDPAVVAAIGSKPIASWILDVSTTQAVSRYLQQAVPGLQGLVVPSVALLDQPDCFNVVVFRDAIDPAACFGSPVHVESIVLTATGA